MNRLKSILLLLLFCVGIMTVTGQDIKCIDGYWKSVKKELKNGEDGKNTTLNGEAYKPSMELHFTKNKVVFSQGGPKIELDYEILEQYLYIGNRKYLIEKLDDTMLVLLEIDDSPFSVEFRRYLKKVNDDHK